MTTLLAFGMTLLALVASAADPASVADSPAAEEEGSSSRPGAYALSTPAGRVFAFSFNPSHFYWSEGNYGGLATRPTYRYTPTQKDKLALPEWMHYRYSTRHKAGFLYGSPPADAGGSVVRVEVVAYNELTFEHGLLDLVVNVTHDETMPLRGVQLKIDNLNLEDMFDARRTDALLAVFADALWTEAEEVRPVWIASALEEGFRRPLLPSLKDGVIIHLAAEANFSSELLELDAETSVLRNFPNCPREFKLTSAERHFRGKGFILDWCQFRLIQQDEESLKFSFLGEDAPEEVDDEEDLDLENETSILNDNETASSANISSLWPLFEPDWVFYNRSELPVPDLDGMYLRTLVPTVVIVVFLLLVSGVMVYLIQANGGDEGFFETFWLVLRDCARTCCCCCACADDDNKKEKTSSGHISAQADFLQSRRASESRYHRASSVQRQTDTLRRLAQQRDLTLRLATAAAEEANANVLADPYYRQQMHGASGQQEENAPVIFLANDDELMDDDETEEEADVATVYPYHDDRQRSYHSRSMSSSLPRRSVARDPLGSLARPVPPPYSAVAVPYQDYNGAYDDEGTYLV